MTLVKKQRYKNTCHANHYVFPTFPNPFYGKPSWVVCIFPLKKIFSRLTFLYARALTQYYFTYTQK